MRVNVIYIYYYYLRKIPVVSINPEASLRALIKWKKAAIDTERADFIAEIHTDF